jgi:hypothetical protein
MAAGHSPPYGFVEAQGLRDRIAPGRVTFSRPSVGATIRIEERRTDEHPIRRAVARR